jgi:hypothetical protein
MGLHFTQSIVKGFEAIDRFLALQKTDGSVTIME